jgi:ubiquinone/menaquinone biosynthesis C-methylase UbiE
MDIDFRVAATEQLGFPGNSFDVITACQCFWYFNHEKVLLSEEDLAR